MQSCSCDPHLPTMKADLESLQNELQQLYSWVINLTSQKDDRREGAKHEGAIFVRGK